MTARIELICVGTELLSGRVNTHQSYLSIQFRKIGLSVSREASLPDDLKAIEREIKEALKRSEGVVVCGGLGPTFDDISREAAAAALGRKLVYHPRIFERIVKKFARYRLPVPEENKRQAFVIKGAKVLENARGSAPGQLLTLGRKTLALLPGPFNELSPMFEGQVLPHFKKTYASGLHAETFSIHLSGVPESVVDEKLQPVIKQAGPTLDFTILASLGQVDFFATATAKTKARASAVLKRIKGQALALVGEHVFGEGGQTLEAAIGDRLRKNRLTLSVAESCTGGLLGQRLTSVAGSSDYFKGGVIAYSNDLKMRILEVKAATLARHGAVSAECVEEMARGVRALSRASIGVAITGVAGPGGGTKEKPVGLVYLGIAGPGKACGHRRLLLSGERDAVRQRAVSSALHWIHRRSAPVLATGRRRP